MKRYRSVAIAELSSTESDSNSLSEDTDPTYALSDDATVAFPDLHQPSDHRLDSASEYGDDMLPDDSESNDDGMNIDCSPRLSTNLTDLNMIKPFAAYVHLPVTTNWMSHVLTSAP